MYANGTREGWSVGDCMNERLQDAFRNAFGSRGNDRWSSAPCDLETALLLILINFAKLSEIRYFTTMKEFWIYCVLNVIAIEIT